MSGEGNYANGVPCATCGVLAIGSAATVAISGLSIEGGYVYNQSGGGIENSGTLTVSQSTVSNNHTYGSSGGGIDNRGT